MNKALTHSLVFLLFVLIFGCAGSKPLSTQSGKPEITIQNKTKKEVTDVLVSEMLSRGFTVKSVSDYTVVFIKPVESLGTQLLLGSRYDVIPEHRTTFMTVESGNGVRIVLSNQIITNPGSAFERITDLSTGNTGKAWQNFLSDFSNIFRGRVGLAVDEKSIVTYVRDGSPSSIAGIQKGDKLLSVDGKPFSTIAQLIGDPDSKVIIIILRGGNEHIFNLTRVMLK